MNIVDSSAWLAYFSDDNSASHFAPAIEDTDELLVPSITITEVFKAVLRQRDEASALTVIAHMMAARVIPLDAELAIASADPGLHHHLPLADSIIYATARRCDAVLWTQDTDFKGLPGVRYFAARKR